MVRWLKTSQVQEVAKYIECYWFLDKSSNSASDEYPKLNPDPSAHLIIYQPNQAYQYERDNEVSEGRGSHWLYPHSKTFRLDHSKPFSCLGIKFHIGALYSLSKLGLPQTLLNTVSEINFDDIKGNALIAEDQLLTAAKSQPDRCCEMLDKLFMPWFLNNREDRHSEITRQVLPALTNKSISELSEGLSCSQRTLERSFLRVTGITLKQCQSMKKLEEILEFLHQRELGEIDWVDIAYQFGFSDQPHLIRYLKKHINLTPKDYAQQRGFTIDVYGGVGST
ncbi:MAG: AraC-like DNA-binding protein [Pseudohongiellaceae bacterium]|jgi:AraC-like DNA-binding protein